MAFNLYITIGGLCVLHDTGSGLRVLIPDGSGHEKHFPALSSGDRYRPEGFGTQCKDAQGKLTGKVVQELSGGDITLDPFKFTTPDTYPRPDFDSVNVVNLHEVTNKAPDLPPLIAMRIPLGSFDPKAVSSQPARWSWLGKTRLMATFVTWKVTGLTNTVKTGTKTEEGIGVDFPGGRVTLRAFPEDTGERRVGLHLGHVVDRERPCRIPPANVVLGVGQKAPHFPVYYRLFDLPTLKPEERKVPEFCSDGTTEECKAPLDFGPAPLSEGSDLGFLPQKESIGLRYTCIIAGYQA